MGRVGSGIYYLAGKSQMTPIVFNRELVSSGSKSLFVGDDQVDKKFFSQKYGSKGALKLTQVYQ